MKPALKWMLPAALAAVLAVLGGVWLRGRNVRAVFSQADAAEAFALAARLVKDCTPRHAGTPGARRAAEWIRQRAVEAGVSARLDEFRAKAPGGECGFANVYAEIPASSGSAAPWIVFISHFDTYPNAGLGFEGANDGASTTGLLLALAKALSRAAPRRHNVALVWTDGEESRGAYGPDDGLQGAIRAADEFRRLGRTVAAAVNLDMLGDRDLHIDLPANTTSALNEVVLKAARRLGLISFVSHGTLEMTDDYSAFLAHGWPATDIIDFSYGPDNRWWHTPEDTMDKISVESLLVAGRIAVETFNILDAQ